MGSRSHGRKPDLRDMIELKPWLQQGDPYVDRLATPLDKEEEISVAVIRPKPLAEAILGTQPLVLHFVREPLRWMRPDINGNLKQSMENNVC